MWVNVADARPPGAAVAVSAASVVQTFIVITFVVLGVSLQYFQ